MITVKVSSRVPNDLFLEIRFYMASIARRINPMIKDFLFIQLKEDAYLYCGETVFVYGVNDFFSNQEKKELFLGKLRENINFPVVLIDSACTRLGPKECPTLCFEVMSKSVRHPSPFNNLRELDSTWNIQNTLVGSNIPPKDMGDFFVEITASPSEVECMFDVIWALKVNRVLTIWPKIALG